MPQSQKLLLYQASEKLVTPYTLCRASADFAATMGASLNELGIGANGRPLTKMARRARLLKAKRAAGADRSGYKQTDVVNMHQAMFPGSPNPILVATDQFADDLWQHLGQNSRNKQQDGPRAGDFVISLSVDLSAVPASSPLRRWCGPVNHQIALWVRNPDNDAAFVLDGMSPYTSGNNGYWAPRAHIARGAKAIEEGLIICELYPVGAWTEAQLATAEKQVTIRELRKTQARLIEQKRELASKLAALQDSSSEQIDDLQSELEACESAASSTREDVLNEGIQALEALK